MRCDQLFRKRGLPARARAPETVVDLDVTALRPSTFARPIPNAAMRNVVFRIAFGVADEHSDTPHPLAPLRTRH